MRRFIVLTTLVSVGALSAAVAAYQQPANPPAQRVVEVEKLTDNLFVLRGGGGNTAVFVTDRRRRGRRHEEPRMGSADPRQDQGTDQQADHDHHQHAHSRRSRQWQRGVPGDGRRRDAREHRRQHEGDASRDRLQPQQDSANIFRRTQVGLPKRMFKDQMTIGTGADQVDLYYFGRGHTNGDAWVVFPSVRVMHAGDIFSGKNLPLLDANNGGSAADHWQHAGQGAQRRKRRRVDHHRSQHGDDDERPQGVRGVQPRVRAVRPGR